MPSVNGNHRQSANRPNDRTLNMWTIVLLIMTVLMLPSVGSGASVTTTLPAVDAATYMDNISDGKMEFNGSFGHGNDVWDYAYVDTRIAAPTSIDRFARAGVEFDLSAFAGLPVGRATLVIQTYFSRDLMALPDGLPVVELWGYAGDGFVSGADLLVGRFLTDFVPVLVDGTNSRGPLGWAPVTLDVSDFIAELANQSQVYAGFRINIADDLSGQRDLFSEFAFGGLDAERPDYLPRLIIVSGAPEPGTFALVGAAVLGVVATRRRKIATPAVCRHSPRPLLPGLTCR